MNGSAILEDTSVGNHTLVSFWKTDLLPNEDNGEYGFDDNMQSEEIYFVIYKVSYDGMQQLRAFYNLADGLINETTGNIMQVCHKENNMDSNGVIKKCGFTYEGALRDYFYMDEKYVSRLYYSMLRSEWDVLRLK